MQPPPVECWARSLTTVLKTSSTHDLCGMLDAVSQFFGDPPKWLKSLVARVVRRWPRQFPADYRLTEGISLALTQREHARKRAGQTPDDLPPLKTPILSSGLLPNVVRQSLPNLPTVSTVAAWLGITLQQLDALADLKNWERIHAEPRRCNYRYRLLSNPQGKVRLLEIPKARLKEIQKQLLNTLVEQIPPHPAAHAYRKHHSVITCARPHVKQPAVLRLDLEDFFPSLTIGRVISLFFTAGYSPAVARVLAGLVTNAAPDSALSQRHEGMHLRVRTTRERLRNPHLPQGAPTSPALSNLMAFRLDCRLAALAEASGVKYTRYADDLIFSGPRSRLRVGANFRVTVLAILQSMGFHCRAQKTRLMTQAARQQVCGVIVNDGLSCGRKDHDRLKAILFNCLRTGPDCQNRDSIPAFKAMLRGKIAFIQQTSPARGAKLQAMFENIQWSNCSQG